MTEDLRISIAYHTQVGQCLRKSLNGVTQIQVLVAIYGDEHEGL